MIISDETSNTQQVAPIAKPLTSLQRLILLVSFLILIFTGIFAIYHRPPSHSATTTIALTPNQSYTEVGQDQSKATVAAITGPLANTPSLWPAGGAITSGFGWRNPPIEDGSELHQGIDIAVEIGTPVVATADGEVVKSGVAGGYGNLVQINHGNGIETLYGHNSQLAVSVGQKVKKGQVISYVGSTGVSTGPHVHYEVRVNGNAINPMKYMVRY